MKLTFVSPFPFKARVAPPQEPPCRWRCAIYNKTSKPFTKGARAPTRLSKRWIEYHGSRNWEGLLDPLDDVLRGEIIRYGSFVEAAYQSFDFDPSSPTYAACSYAKSMMLERCSTVHGCGYRVTKNLHATSSIPLPRWIERMPRWMQVQSSWIGYVAVCNDKEEISRLGRRDIVIALRGTATCLEWLENLRATLTHCSGDNIPTEQNDEPMVEAGVLSLYTSGTNTCPSLQQLLRHEVLKILKLYKDEPLSLTITGHSLGASLAVIAAYDIKTTINHSPHLSVISFGGPRVGNQSFRHHLEQQGVKVLRIVNSDDLITKVPGFFVEDHDGVIHEQNARVARLTKWIQKRVKDSRQVYANIGHELRLSSRDSLQLNSINVATCHDLKTYLDLVNGFVSSTCPFKAGARRMLKKATNIPTTK
ncbi:putative phospholipase A(1) [Helianthus annuus]|uniref:Phospholipase A(1) n=1 Tax=Helianthus annuus TaxID=4232 RepID=A0A251VDN3_HELAN|nr:phospholipase A(1) DAD1, chloroplastic [Helianthus annuus]KAF5816702.1 putative phospholipase A(1) [Helianthus annuus]KAJ0594930.1 putative phospholipase A(1) [Helianthus annuus]KAJ0603271.1 putative phospholipase A(1) [Helianthus annuus]KAJ0609973.1 putative phospholipase A(1) [Helianthus annuus]KAJ0775759.1 putative phospholipase A(1) [Helianthus annuus]